MLEASARRAEAKRLETLAKADAPTPDKPAAKPAADGDASARKPDDTPKPTVRPIGFRARADVPQGVIALVGGRVVTMRGDEVLERGVVLVRDNRIAAVGPVDTVEIPAGARIIDCTGKTLLPGFIDVHAHGPQGQTGSPRSRTGDAMPTWHSA